MVEVAEVGHDDRNRQGDREDAGDGAHGAHQLPPDGGRRHVPVAHRRHGHHRPPESFRYAGERRAETVDLGEVNGARKDYDPDEEEEDQQGELS